MATFVIIPVPPIEQKLGDVISGKFGNSAYQLPQGEWLVSYQGTSKQLSDELGITDGTNGSAVVLGVTSYWGLASKDLWEWLSLNSN